MENSLTEIAKKWVLSHPDTELLLMGMLTDAKNRIDSASLTDIIFGKALSKTISRKIEEETNLYLKQYESSQIHLFNLLATKVPQVTLTTEIANDELIQAMSGKETVTLIDFGIGTGRQICELLLNLAEKKKKPSSIKIIGIEPGKQSLNLARKNIEKLSKKLAINVHFEGLRCKAEDLNQSDWNRLEKQSNILVNASFALHHVNEINGYTRTDLLKKIRGLNPLIFVLAEPDVDHYTNHFLDRFQNCLDHFSKTFELIDLLEIEKSDKISLKVNFFGREIDDIVGNPNEIRSERHESTHSWLERLRQAGFSQKDKRSMSGQFRHEVIQINVRDGVYSLCHDQFPLISVICVEARAN